MPSDFTLLGFSVWALVKAFYLIGIGLYIFFAIVVVRQINLMTETIDAPFDPTLRVIAWVHLIFALAVFLIALFSL